MKSKSDQPNGDKTNQTTKPGPKYDLKVLSMAEVEKKLESSLDGLAQEEAKKRLA